jgi:hypothetical protein
MDLSKADTAELSNELIKRGELVGQPWCSRSHFDEKDIPGWLMTILHRFTPGHSLTQDMALQRHLEAFDGA